MRNYVSRQDDSHMNTFHWRQVIDIWRLAIKCPEKLWRALRGDGGARTSTTKNSEMEEPRPQLLKMATAKAYAKKPEIDGDNVDVRQKKLQR